MVVVVVVVWVDVVVVVGAVDSMVSGSGGSGGVREKTRVQCELLGAIIAIVVSSPLLARDRGGGRGVGGFLGDGRHVVVPLGH